MILFLFLFFLRTSTARGGGGAARFFLFLFFPVQQTTSGIGHRVYSKVRGANRQKNIPGIGFFFKCVPDLSDGKSVEPVKFREPVPIRTGPHSPKEKEKNKLATVRRSQYQNISAAAAAAEAPAEQLKQQHGPTPT